MFRTCVAAVLAICVVGATTLQAEAQKKKVDVTKKWSGSVEDENLPKPNCITSVKGLETVWKAWKIAAEMPKIDFTKEMVVAVYSVGSKLNLGGASLDEQGNLDVLGFGTRDLRPGFRYVLGVVSNEGVKTVNKMAPPKE